MQIRYYYRSTLYKSDWLRNAPKRIFRVELGLGWNLEVGAHNYNNEVLISRGSYESKFISMDTLIVFVFNSDTLSSRGWDYVKDHNNVTQRYDLSLSNLRNLNWRIAFPPTEEMRNIKMWPPYGTYDSLGHPNN